MLDVKLSTASTWRIIRQAAKKRTVLSRAPSRSISNISSDNDGHTRSVGRLNFSLIGPPGSGKGSYGKLFSKSLNLPMVTVSDLLRTLRPDLIASLSDGTLVDDAIVGETVLQGLSELQKNDTHRRPRAGYVLDGFPRTQRQVALMEETWPASLQVSSVIHLRVPDFVCTAKMLGRRTCSKCGAPYNVNGIDRGAWHLPPVLPPEGHLCVSTQAITAKDGGGNAHSNTSVSSASCDWSTRRDDDTPGIVEERLKVYHQHADPMLKYFKHANMYRLLALTPHRGFEDLPVLMKKLHSHVGMS